MTADPFTVLGLPARPDLTDDDVRSAWRRIAAATHPDRPDGGDPGRFAVASAAWAELRTSDGRGEAYAGLAAGSRWRPAPRGQAGAPPRAGAGAHSRGDPLAGAGDAGTFAARIRRGRPAMLALRVAITVGVCVAAFGIAGAQPAAAGLAAGALTWFGLTARHDLMPPGRRPPGTG